MMLEIDEKQVKNWRGEDWDGLYRERPVHELPWYYPRLDPDVAAALERLEITRGRVLDIGAGPGTQAAALAALGFEVTATDVSPTAVQAARALARDQNADVRVMEDDILNTHLQGRFDLALDRGCFHALDPAKRGVYASALHKLLAPGGTLLLKTFSHLQPGTDGPHRLRPGDINHSLGSLFEIVSITGSVFHGAIIPPPKALFCVLRGA